MEMDGEIFKNLQSGAPLLFVTKEYVLICVWAGTSRRHILGVSEAFPVKIFFITISFSNNS